MYADTLAKADRVHAHWGWDIAYLRIIGRGAIGQRPSWRQSLVAKVVYYQVTSSDGICEDLTVPPLTNDKDVYLLWLSPGR